MAYIRWTSQEGQEKQGRKETIERRTEEGKEGEETAKEREEKQR